MILEILKILFKENSMHEWVNRMLSSVSLGPNHVHFFNDVCKYISIRNEIVNSE